MNKLTKKFATETMIGLLSLLLFSCSPQSEKSEFAQVSDEQLNESQKAELQALINSELEKRNDDGTVADLKGFKTSDKLGSEGHLANNDGFQELIQNDEQVFEFLPPDGVKAEFSEPVMVNGASLLLTSSDLKARCEGLAYQADEPTMKDIIEHSQKTNVCGALTVNFCIRLTMAQQIVPGQPNYTYTESPSLDLTLPCPGDSFAGLKIDIADGKSHTTSSSEPISIEALRSVISVYLTNSPGCLEGGEWQHIKRDEPIWNLAFTENTATVYAKFKDVFDAESECISDSIGYGSTVDQCFAEDSNYLAENILSGVAIGGLEGSGGLSYPVCTEDGQTGCIASTEFQAVAVSGLAAKVLSSTALAGVSGGVSPETRDDCTSGGQEDCITNDTYRTMDLSAKDSGGASDLNSTLFSARIKSTGTFEFWDEAGARHTASGDGNIVEANVRDSITIFGVTGTAGASPDCASISVGGSWILVPGDSDYGTKDFCVMKYEAKCSAANGQTCNIATHSPISQTSNTPWVSIDQQDAKTECASLGKGYHLVTNAEWMTIAANLANVDGNWSGLSVGSGYLHRGHSDNSPTVACAADSDDAKAYVEDDAGTDCTAYSAGDSQEDDAATQRRTHTLSNGAVIWDLAGNVYEWTSYFNNEDKPSDDGTPDDAWDEYPDITGTTNMPLGKLIPTAAVKSFWNNTWNSSQSIGAYYPGLDSAGGALRRGGLWYDQTSAGVFTAGLLNSPTDFGNDIGFRCAVIVP